MQNNSASSSSVDCQFVYHLGCIITRHETTKEYFKMFQSMDEEIYKLFSVKRQETLTRSMNDNDEAIFAAVRDEYISPKLILGN